MKRTTISIPTEYYERIIKLMREEGYTTVNELLLDLLRHHFDASKTTYHHYDANVTLKNQGLEPAYIPVSNGSVTKSEAMNGLINFVTANHPEVTQRVMKKKIDKNGMCPHFISAGGYCKSCEL